MLTIITSNGSVSQNQTRAVGSARSDPILAPNISTNMCKICGWLIRKLNQFMSWSGHFKLVADVWCIHRLYFSMCPVSAATFTSGFLKSDSILFGIWMCTIIHCWWCRIISGLLFSLERNNNIKLINSTTGSVSYTNWNQPYQDTGIETIESVHHLQRFNKQQTLWLQIVFQNYAPSCEIAKTSLKKSHDLNYTISFFF